MMSQANTNSMKIVYSVNYDKRNSRSVPLARRLGLIIWHTAETSAPQDYIDSRSSDANWQSIHTTLSLYDAPVEFF